MNRLRYLFCICLIAGTTFSQPTVFSFEAFNASVVSFHPVAQQAKNILLQADALAVKARGAFDPNLQLETKSKTFAGISYYNYADAEVKIPLWYGMDIVGGIENISGSRVNPEVTNGSSSYLGIEVPLLKNLSMDKRRAAVLQAKLLQQQTQFEARLAMNDLLYEAQSAYWQWAGAWEQFQLFENTLQANRKRFELIKTAYRLGDKTAMDTVEAFVQLQTIEYGWMQARLEWQNMALAASYFLWDREGKAVSLPERVVPESTSENSVLSTPAFRTDSIMQYVSNHPKLQWYRLKLETNRVDLRLKRQSTLPSLNVKLNVLSKNYFSANPFQAAYLQHNQQLGVSFYMPVLLREARSDYRLSQLKLQHSQYDMSGTQWALDLKIQQYLNEATSLKQQLGALEQTVLMSEILLRNETLRYELGESSLFLVNSRETKALEARQKLIAARIKSLKNQSALQWSAGILQY